MQVNGTSQVISLSGILPTSYMLMLPNRGPRAVDSHYFMSASSLHACLFPVALSVLPPSLPPSLASAEWSDDGSFS